MSRCLCMFLVDHKRVLLCIALIFDVRRSDRRVCRLRRVSASDLPCVALANLDGG